MRVVAVVPAKGTSERVANKNRAILDGEYLFKRKLRQLVACPFITEVVLDTDCDELAALAADLPVKRLKRPPELASNAADGHDIFAFACASVEPADVYIQALCTAPFVDERTLQRAFDTLTAQADAEGLVAVRTMKHYEWSKGEPLYGRGRIPNSVDLPPVTLEAMSLYMVKRVAGAPAPKRRFAGRSVLFEVSPTEDIDINFPDDLELAERICAGDRAAENARLALLKHNLTSALLADICKERGLRVVLPPKIQPVIRGRMLGRAKTLALGPLAPDADPQDWLGIYRALDSYAFVRSGDIIVVATDVPERAYFGDLNANLAIRAGAAGAIINGLTRDSRNLNELAFPTYAHGSHCDDIKYEGTLRSMNRPVRIGSVEICNNDIIYADEDGIVAIRARDWPSIRDAAIESLSREASIRIQIMKGEPIETILRRSGEF